MSDTEREQRVTALELFFDLVFVFAITQVTGFIYHDPSWTTLIEALAVLMVLWFAWTGYAWLGNTAGTDEGPIRVVVLVVMGPLLIASLAVPHAFGRDALVFGIAYFLVRALHIAAYAVLARADPSLRIVVVRLAQTILPAAGVLVLVHASCTAQAVLRAGSSPSRSTTAGSSCAGPKIGRSSRRTSPSATA